MNDVSYAKLIEAKDVCFRYPTSPMGIFQNLNLHINENEFVSILGESGSGKTTLIKLLAGLESPTKGEVTRHCSTKGSFVFQSPVLLDWLNVVGNITFPNKVALRNGKV